MSVEPWLIFIAGIITVAGSVFGARYASKASVKVKEIDVDAAAYERADRINAAAFLRLEGEVTRQGREISELRTTVEKVTKAFRVAINFIEQFLLWERDGSLPPRPNIPESLKEYLDPSLIREHIRQQKQDDRTQP